ncbi:MAG: hypothetical protein Q9M89_04930 [Persephonella sp.]|nr:hypothetical protein [Persephonella sp.]
MNERVLARAKGDIRLVSTEAARKFRKVNDNAV